MNNPKIISALSGVAPKKQLALFQTVGTVPDNRLGSRPLSPPPSSHLANKNE